MTALPPLLSSGLLPKELDLASTTVTETEVEIIPLQSIERVRLLSGIYGPFKPPQPTRVPLWLAIYLRTKSKATILPPEWMSVASLQSHLQQEQRNPGFSDLPLHWIGVSNALLQSVASSDLEDSSQVRSLIKDLREIRQSKILAGIEMINPVHLEMTNIGLHEVAELRPFFKTAFDDLKAFSRLRYESQEAQAESTTPLPSSSSPTHTFDRRPPNPTGSREPLPLSSSNPTSQATSHPLLPDSSSSSHFVVSAQDSGYLTARDLGEKRSPNDPRDVQRDHHDQDDDRGESMDMW